MADQARKKFLGTFKSLLVSGDYSDFVITCGSDTYNVHKAGVCTRSGFLRGKERFVADQEAVRCKADFSEEEPAIVKLLVQYLYEGEYKVKMGEMALATKPCPSPVVTAAVIRGFNYEFPHTCIPECPVNWALCPHYQCKEDTCGESCVDFVCTKCCDGWASPTPSKSDASHHLHAKMYEIGDKYDVLGLKQLALANFSLVCKEQWNSDQFPLAAHHAFSTTPESDKGLRDIVAKTIVEHMQLLKKPAIEALLNEFNGLAVGVLKIKGKELGWI